MSPLRKVTKTQKDSFGDIIQSGITDCKIYIEGCSIKKILQPFLFIVYRECLEVREEATLGIRVARINLA